MNGTMEGDFLTLNESCLLKGQFSINNKSKLNHVAVYSTRIICTPADSASSSRRNSFTSQPDTAIPSNSKSASYISLDDSVGCDCMRGKTNANTEAYLIVYSYPRRKKLGGKNCRKRETLTLKFDHFPKYEENQEEALRWNIVLTYAIRKLHMGTSPVTMPLSRKLLILVNPFSGPGKALHIFQQQVIPVLAEAGLLYDLIVTERAGHAKELVKEVNIDDWYGIIIVSGDGLIFEVVNGLMERRDWEKAIKIPIGVIPGGSGNALACAICHQAGESYMDKHVLHSSFIVAKNDVVPMDLVAIDTCTGQRIYSFLSIGWGMMADVDIESEKYRYMGNARFTVMAAIKLTSMKKYHGQISFLPVDPYSPPSENNLSKQTRKSTFDSAEATSRELNGNSERGAGDDNSNLIVRTGALSVGAENVHILTNLLPPLNEPVPANWITIEEEFILVGGVYQSHLAKDNMMTPNATLDDGVIHLVLVKATISRLKLAQVFTALESGEEVVDPSIEIIRVHAFRLVPLTAKGLMTVDGEVIDYGPLQGQVLPSMACVMSIKRRND